MKNTLRQTSYILPVGVGTADLMTVFPRNTFKASFPTLLVRPARAGGAGLILAIFPINSWINLSIGDGSGALAGAGTAGVNTASNFLSSSLLWSTELSGLFTVRFIHCSHWFRLHILASLPYKPDMPAPASVCWLVVPRGMRGSPTMSPTIHYVPKGRIWWQTVQMPT